MPSHFADGTPSPANPYQTLNFGYKPLVKLLEARPLPLERNFLQDSTPKKRTKITLVSEEAEHNPISQDAIVACMNDHSYTHPLVCLL